MSTKTSELKKPDAEIERCATCRAACPVHTDTRAYVDLVAQGRYEEAFEEIRRTNPFPSVCAVICHHPCEEKCRREKVDQPVALRNLKRFAIERALERRTRARKRANITQERTVGVVGSGPAGLTVAHDCIRAGYAVTVYEALPKAGGLLASAIPAYRLPDETLAQDVDEVLALGVEVKTGVRVGEDVALDELRKKHAAVVLALGLPVSRSLPLGNADHPDVLLALPFLRAARFGERPAVREDVTVIGGGNVAVDVARTAVRLGAKTVKMVCLENEEEMPAWEWECREALEEGISFVHRRGPTDVLVEGGRVVGLATRGVTRVFDEAGRFNPAYDDADRSTLPGSMVILAIGQAADLALVEGTGVRTSRPGRLAFDPKTMAASEKGVFACGEVVTGPGSAIEAVASGHRAARAVLRYLETGEIAEVEDEKLPEEVGELPEEVAGRTKRIARLAMPTLPAAERVRSFVQFELGYDERSALAEARRCLSCTAGATVDEDKCAACLTCLRVCPFGVPAVDKVAVMCSDLCQACGLCAVECPALAISIQRFAVGMIRDRVAALLSKEPAERVEFVCAQDAASREELADRVESRDGARVAIVPVTCAARVEEVDMMKPFELGAKAVAVRACAECRYPAPEGAAPGCAVDRLAPRVERTRAILDACGVGGDKLVLEPPRKERAT